MKTILKVAFIIFTSISQSFQDLSKDLTEAKFPNCYPNYSICKGYPRCILMSQLCDSKPHCPNGTDEGPNCTDLKESPLLNSSTCLFQKSSDRDKICNLPDRLKSSTMYFNKCDYEGTCDHYCAKDGTNYRCTCHKSFKTVGRDCLVKEPKDKATGFIVGSPRSIIFLKKDFTQSTKKLSKRKSNSKIIVIYNENKICHEKIPAHRALRQLRLIIACDKIKRLDNGEIKLSYDEQIPIYGKWFFGKIFLLGYDWIGKNWIILRYARYKFAVSLLFCSKNGKVCKVTSTHRGLTLWLKWRNGNQVDSTEGCLFMLTRYGLNRVEFASNKTTTIVKWSKVESDSVKGLTLDMVKKHIYFTFANNLYRCNYDGKSLHRITYFEKKLIKPSLQFFNSTMIVFDFGSQKWYKKDLRNFLYQTENKNFESVPIPESLKNERYLYSLQGFHESLQLQTKMENCSCNTDLIVPYKDPKTENLSCKCMCQEDFKKTENNTCIEYEVGQKPFVSVFSSDGSLVSYTLKSFEINHSKRVLPSFKSDGSQNMIHTYHIYWKEKIVLGVNNSEVQFTKFENNNGIANWKKMSTSSYDLRSSCFDQRTGNLYVFRSYYVDIIPIMGNAYKKTIKINSHFIMASTINYNDNKLEFLDMDKHTSATLNVCDLFARNCKKIDSFGRNYEYPVDLFHIKDRFFIIYDKFFESLSSNQKGIRQNVKTYKLSKSPLKSLSISYIKNQYYIIASLDGMYKIYKNGQGYERILKPTKDDVSRVILTNPELYQDNPCKDANCSEISVPLESGKCECACRNFYKISQKDKKTCEKMEINGTIDCNKPSFRCTNNYCIEQSQKCDGKPDCEDESDELECGKSLCSASKRSCGKNLCIPSDKFCDGKADCPNNIDEMHCNKPPCYSHQFHCTSDNSCIPHSSVCDWYSDCSDGEDERANCTKLNDKKCQFACDGHTTCLKHEQVCDGVFHCRDGQDEAVCGVKKTCSADEFSCFPTNILCINWTLVCDEISHCPFSQDENLLNCPAVKNNKTCPAEFFTCGKDRQYCIPLSLKCNGIKNCIDGEDEKGCPKDDDDCNKPSNRCNGRYDCPDKSDESNCNQTVCEKPNYKCLNSTKCIKYTKTCDRRSDCPLGDDEGGLCKFKMCLYNRIKCEGACFNSPKGFQCVCPPGMALLDGSDSRCVDNRSCSDYGTCSQICTKKRQCSCLDNYTLDPFDNFTCIPSSEDTANVIYSAGHSIFLYNGDVLNRRKTIVASGNSTRFELTDGLQSIVGLDYYDNKTDGSMQLFFTDIGENSIFRSIYKDNVRVEIKPIISYGLTTAEGIAVDWINEKIYWTDAALDQIQVSNFNGDFQMVLVSGTIGNPRSIAVSPKKGYLFWTDWNRHSPRIERCSMDGSDRIFLTNLKDMGGSWPNGLTIDNTNDRIYWADAHSHSIYTSDMDGKNVIPILTNHPLLTHPFSIHVFGSFVFWIDWGTSSILRANKFDGSDVYVVHRIKRRPYGLKIFHPLVQEPGENPCKDNGGCDENAICLLKHNNKTGLSQKSCKCLNLYEFSESSKKCTRMTEFLLMGGQMNIRGVSSKKASSNVFPSIPGFFVVTPKSLVYDYKQYKIFWADIGFPGRLFLLRLFDIKTNTSSTIFESGSYKVNDLDIDIESRNLYFITYNERAGEGSIRIINLDRNYSTAIVNHANEESQTFIPESLAIAPVSRKLYWIEQNSADIHSSNLDGTDYTSIRVKNNTCLGNPIQIAFDKFTQRLWWHTNDNKVSYLCSCDEKGENFKAKVLKVPLSSFTVQEDVVFTAAGQNIYKYVENKKASFENATSTLISLFYHKEMKLPPSPCKSNPCSHICIPVQTEKTYVCRCSEGYELVDGKCTFIKSFLMTVTTTGIMSLSLGRDLKSSMPIYSSSHSIQCAAYDVKNNWIYIFDQITRSIKRYKTDMSKEEVVISDGLGYVVNMKYDWTTDNLYFYDRGYDVIELIHISKNLTELKRFVIFSQMNFHLSFALDPINGFMYINQRSVNRRNSISRYTLDGTNKVVLRSETKNDKSQFSLAYDNNRLFFCENNGKSIVMMDLNSNITTTIVENPSEFCNEFDVMNDNLYIFNSSDKSLSKINIKTKENTVLKKFSDIKSNLMPQLVIFDKSKQSGQSSCSKSTEKCQGTCVPLSKTKKKCICSFGISNGTECNEPDSYLAYASDKYIKIAHTHISEHSSQHADDKKISNDTVMKAIVGLTADVKNEVFYYTDSVFASIFSINFNGSNPKKLMSFSSYSDGIAFDELNKFLYFTSNSQSSIFTYDLQKGEDYTMLIRLGRGDRPRAIVVDPCVRKLFWTSLRRESPSIQSSSLIGWNRKAIISTKIIAPNGLAIDQKAQKLYWADAKLDKIERCDYDGLNRVVIVASGIYHPFGLTTLGDYLYWTDIQKKAIVRANKYTGGEMKVIKRDMFHAPLGIVAISEDIPTCKDHPCYKHNGDCEQNCNTLATGEVQCSCFPNYKLNKDNKTCSYIDRSSITCDNKSQFRCLEDKKCIAFEATCDGEKHCSNGTDELYDYCHNRRCPYGYFLCNNTQCIKSTLVCNGVKNCKDGSDESICPVFNETACGQDKFACASDGKCILKKHVCDSERDCTDASDETNCPFITHCVKDSKRMIKCNGTTACILPEWKCDGVNDCWNNEDEIDCPRIPERQICPEGWIPCTNSTGFCHMKQWSVDGQIDCPNGEDEIGYTCPPDTFECSHLHCIPKDYVCDNIKDCSNGADERNCATTNCSETQFQCKQKNITRCISKKLVCDKESNCDDGADEYPNQDCKNSNSICHADEFDCGNGTCIPNIYRCDNIVDCRTRADETENCHYECKDNEALCTRGKRRCVPRCNGKVECPDGIDELLCPTTLPDNKYQCNNGNIIDASKLCNTFDDCGDNSDENDCGVDLCTLRKPCHHICTVGKYSNGSIMKGYKCSCRQGYKLNGTSCEPFDICSSLKPCSQKCINRIGKIGSYRCGCVKGYYLNISSQICLSTSKIEKQLIVVYKYDFRLYSLDGKQLSNPTKLKLINAVALDFHWPTQTIYITDVSSEGSKIVKFFRENGTSKVLHTSVKNPDGIAVDWVGKNLYWADKQSKTIEVSDLEGRYRKVLLRNLGKPRAIVLHPKRGFLFYSDWGKHEIVRTGMDGFHVKRIVTEDIEWLNALTIDYTMDKLYWGDAKNDFIGQCNLDGSGKRRIIQHNLQHIFALTFFEGYLYWSDWEMSHVEKARANGKDRQKVRAFTHKPMDLHVFHPARQPKVPDEDNPCVREKCGQGALCLIRPGGITRQCVCPEKYFMSPDKSICLPNCTSSEFTCFNTFKCIPNLAVCNGEDDCGDGSDEKGPCRKYHCRKPGYFQCANANSSEGCVSPASVCDGYPHCMDHSDESNCANHTCLRSQFKCASPPKCIPRSKMCDGRPDCGDYTDEKDCGIKKCEENQFQCDDKSCILYVWKCDNDNDCNDKSDESNCKNVTCKEGHVKCPKSGKCIPKAWLCDGDNDCPDHSDEKDCSNKTCEITYFQCHDKQRCIPGRWKCDYESDCLDGSDEQGCIARNCSEKELKCQVNQMCIPPYQICDGINHCSDGSDETICNNGPLNCGEDFFLCQLDNKCIHKSLRCDGQVDCSKAEDEVNCTGCSSKRKKCLSGECLPLEQFCDGHADCLDGSDEFNSTCIKYICLPGHHRCDKTKCLHFRNLCDGVRDCLDGSDEIFCAETKTCGADFPVCMNGKCLSMDPSCQENHVCSANNSQYCGCAKNPTLCDHLCIDNPSKRTHSCSCISNSLYERKQHSCKAKTHQKTRLLLGIKNEVHVIEDFDKSPNKFKTQLTINFRSIQIYYEHSMLAILFASAETKNGSVILRKDFRTSSFDRINLTTGFHTIVNQFQEIDHFALDFSQRRIYFTSSLKGHSIRFCTFFGSNITTILYLRNRPVAISLNTKSSYRHIYWIEADKPRLAMAYLDGTNEKTIWTDMGTPTDVKYDMWSNRIYWVDMRRKTIEFINVDSISKDKIEHYIAWKFNHHSNLSPYKIEIYETAIFLIAHLQGKVFALKKVAYDHPIDMIDDTLSTVENGVFPPPIYSNNKLSQVASVSVLSTLEGLYKFKQPCFCGLGLNSMCVISHNKTSCLCPGHKIRRIEKGQSCDDHFDETAECENGGTCDKIGNSKCKCKCLPGFEGPYCRLKSEKCENIYCKNGKCQNNKCKCDIGWEGEKCDYAACYRCANGGQCYLDSNNVTRCKCPKGFDPSTNCRTKCSSHKCENECEKFEGGTTCKCGEHYSHKEFGCVPLCTYNKKSICSVGVCSIDTKLCNCSKSGIICSIDNRCNCTAGAKTLNFDFIKDKIQCNCLPGYSGEYCEIGKNISKCSCLNEGVCKSNETSTWCMCTKNFTGSQCEINKSTITCKNGTGNNCNKQIKGDTKRVSATIIIVPVVVVLGICIIAIGIFLKRCKKNYNNKYCQHDGPIEITNPMFRRDELDEPTFDEGAPFQDKADDPTNSFANPLYGAQLTPSMGDMKESEGKELLLGSD
ncbi:DgyrCDS948 [Dimorphilus gyrociliatus]|uniref:DgyrCDS948 n=1 Tax=Dimorphilus gyrociliatus TaxID=2664684 RepID=A0A7I8V614_9ANNE|nr:DgyrCDS948 [Dimorphilus gyrociliatus]